MEAQHLYQRVLELAPKHPQANYSMGVIANQLGEFEKAVALFELALASEPDNSIFLNSLGNTLRSLGRFGDAERSCRRALALNPQYAEAHNNLGNALANAGRFREAEQSYGSALACNPDLTEAYSNLAILLTGQGRFSEAEGHCRRAVVIKPDFIEAHNALGNALVALGRPLEAEQSYRRALSLKPHHSEAHNNLANALAALGRFEEAESSYERALALKPSFAEAYSNLANVQWSLGRFKEAERNVRYALTLKPDFAEAQNILGNLLQTLGNTRGAENHYRRAIALKPSLAEAHNNLGNTLRKLGRLEEAERSYRATLALKPGYPEAHLNLGHVLQDLGNPEEAEQSYRNASTLKPNFFEAQAAWIHQCRHLCAWSRLDREAATFFTQTSTIESGRVPPFAFLAAPEGTGRQQLASARAFADVQYRGLVSSPALCDARRHSIRTKLRIGYLSADYYDHPTSHLLVEVLENHDRRSVETFGYSHGPDDGSLICRRVRAAFDVLRDIRHVSNEEAAYQIATDQVDILVDLKGYTTGNRTQILALRPAPIQVSWLGYPGTLGHPRLADYLIGDPVVTPLEQASAYSETLALMPHCYQPNDRRRQVGERPTRKEAGLPEKAFVFCCFNKSYKITPAMLDLWCRLLQAVPESVLWLLQTTRAARDNLSREARTRGIAADRIVFAPTTALDKHLGRLQLADLALDTYPVTSHTTASDALWAGVPLVTLLGETFISRVAASVLTAAELPELVTRTPNSYFDLARTLAIQPEQLKQLKDRLIRNRLSCALFDSIRFTKDLERLYEGIWAAHTTGKWQHILVQNEVREARLNAAPLKQRSTNPPARKRKVRTASIARKKRITRRGK